MNDFDRSPWLINDKAWREDRHEKWESLKPKLDNTTIDRKYHKYLRDYFINGVDFDRKTFLDYCTFFKMWLHPNESDQHVARVFNSISSKIDYRETWLLFKSLAHNGYQAQTGLPFGEDGILFGREEQFTKIIVPPTYTPEKIDIGGKKVARTMIGAKDFFLGFCVSGAWFIQNKHFYKNCFFQFLIDYWFSCFGYAVDSYDRDEVAWLFRAIYYFDIVGVDNDPGGNRARFAECMKEVLDTRELPEIVAEKWAWIKTPEGRKPGSEAIKDGIFSETNLSKLLD